ncbi:MAG TPA: hypothetical protein VJ890_04260 [Vineibacter sp.]|nr:hypothetical protein [Vineibacter sp.]
MAQTIDFPADRAIAAYQPDFARQAEHLCRLGAHVCDLAVALDVDEAAISHWIEAHAPFAQAVARGRAHADSVVTTSLFQRAKGMELPMVKWVREDGRMVAKTYSRHIPPDTKACVFWLQSRRPDLWGRRRATPRKAAVNDAPVKPDVHEAQMRPRHMAADDTEPAAPVNAAQDSQTRIDRPDETPQACLSSSGTCTGEDRDAQQESHVPGALGARHSSDASSDGHGVTRDGSCAPPTHAGAVVRMGTESRQQWKWKRKQKRADKHQRRAAAAIAMRPLHQAAAA